jgi:hypothetical protein
MPPADGARQAPNGLDGWLLRNPGAVPKRMHIDRVTVPMRSAAGTGPGAGPPGKPKSVEKGALGRLLRAFEHSVTGNRAVVAADRYPGRAALVKPTRGLTANPAGVEDWQINRDQRIGAGSQRHHNLT